MLQQALDGRKGIAVEIEDLTVQDTVVLSLILLQVVKFLTGVFSPADMPIAVTFRLGISC